MPTNRASVLLSLVFLTGCSSAIITEGDDRSVTILGGGSLRVVGGGQLHAQWRADEHCARYGRRAEFADGVSAPLSWYWERMTYRCVP